MTGNPSKLSSAGSKKGKAGGGKQRPRCPKRSRAAEPAGGWDRTGIRDPGWRRTGGWWCWRERERAGARWKGSVADGVEAAGALALGRYGQPGLSATVEARSSGQSFAQAVCPGKCPTADARVARLPAAPARVCCCGRACSEAAAPKPPAPRISARVEVALHASPSPARHQCLSRRRPA